MKQLLPIIVVLIVAFGTASALIRSIAPAAPRPATNANHLPLSVTINGASIGVIKGNTALPRLLCTVKNLTESSQVVASVHAGCGCITTDAVVPRTLEPGQSWQFHVIIDSNKLQIGNHTYGITLLDFGGQRIGFDRVSYNYRPVFDTTSQYVRLSRKDAQPGMTNGRVTIVAPAGSGSSASATTTDPDRFYATIDSVHPHAEGDRVDVFVSAPANSFQPGEAISLLIQSPTFPDATLAIPVIEMHGEWLQASPESIFFGKHSPSGNRVERSIWLTGLAATRNDIEASSTAGFLTSLQPLTTDNRRELKVYASTSQPGLHSGTITISAAGDSIVVPVSILIMKAQ